MNSENQQPNQSTSKWATLKKGAAYSLAAGAATTMASDADAALNYSGEQNISINQFSALDLDLNLDAQGDVLLKNYVFGTNYQGATVNYFPGSLVTFTTGLTYVSALSFGDTIDAGTVGSFFGSMAYSANPDSQFDSVTDAYIGLSFPAGPDTYYGWIRVDVNNAAGTFVVKDWAYQDISGKGITAGAAPVPEPGTLGLLAAGSLGLAAMRRRKKAAATN